MRKKAGHCTQCEKLIYETVWRHMDGPLEGEIGQFGAPHIDAFRVTFVLTDGNTMDQLFCETCLLDDLDLEKCWAATMEAFRFERDVVHPYNISRGVKPMTDSQRYHADKAMLHVLNNPPIGILAKQRVNDIGKTHT